MQEEGGSLSGMGVMQQGTTTGSLRQEGCELDTMTLAAKSALLSSLKKSHGTSWTLYNDVDSGSSIVVHAGWTYVISASPDLARPTCTGHFVLGKDK